jgi:DNA processing protein
MDELVYWLAIQKVYWWFPPTKIESAIKELGSIEKLWYANEKYLINLGVKSEFVKKFIEYRKSINLQKFAEQLDKIKRKNIGILPYVHPEYPEALKNVKWPKKYLAPRVLFHTGTPLRFINLEKSIGVVGRRFCSANALETAYAIGAQLAKHNYVTVSGLAVGVDSEAHKGTIDNKGLTIAVLPWLIPIYPPENLNLAEKVKEHGCLLSECYRKPKGGNIKWRIVERNKIISGLSATCLVVVETGKKGGTLRTAEMALEMKKRVFVFTPKVTDDVVAKGYMYLISRGAEPFNSVDELIKRIDETYQTSRSKSQNFDSTNDLTKFLGNTLT